MSGDDARYAALEARLEQSIAWATKAKADAAKSISEVQGIASGLEMHLARLEAIRAAEAAADKLARETAETARKAAAGAHAKRFEEQGKAIHAISEQLQRSTARSDRGKWILGAVVAVITTLSMQAVEAIKIIYAPAPPTVATPAGQR